MMYANGADIQNTRSTQHDCCVWLGGNSLHQRMGRRNAHRTVSLGSLALLATEPANG